jgi:hypothetical protein
MRRPSVHLALWTLFVWGVRLKNADGSIAAIALAITFLGLALLVLRYRGNGFFAVTLAGWTIVVWLVRMVDIVLFSDHSGGFKVVHAGLGVVSFVLAARVNDELSGKRRTVRT